MTTETRREIEYEDQKIGTHRLNSLFKGEIGIDGLVPFAVSDIYGAPEGRTFYVGKPSPQRQITVRLDKRMAEVVDVHKNRLLAIPNHDQYGLYQWLNFYELFTDNRINPDELISSQRIYKDEFKIQPRGWYGFENQMFLDFIDGGLEIDPSWLRPFVARVSENDPTVVFGTVKGKIIESRFAELQDRLGQSILFKPQYNPEFGYTWIEGYTPEEDRSLCAKEFQPGKSELLPWKGLNKRIFIDWVLGNIPFEKARSIEEYPDNNSLMIVLSSSRENMIVITLKGKTNVEKSERIKLVPCKDDLFEWVEVYKADENKETDTILASYKIDRLSNKKLDGTWPGPERQRFIDYLEGKLKASDIKPFSGVVRSGTRLNICTYDGKNIFISLKNHQAPFNIGDTVYVSPTMDQEGNIVFIVNNENSYGNSANFVFDLKTHKFKSMNPLRKTAGQAKPKGYWTEERTETEAWEFYSTAGKLSQSALVENSRQDLLHACREYPGGLVGIKRKFGIIETNHNSEGNNQHREVVDISSEEADADLDKFLN